jgi:hypothetical protein
MRAVAAGCCAGLVIALSCAGCVRKVASSSHDARLLADASSDATTFDATTHDGSPDAAADAPTLPDSAPPTIDVATPDGSVADTAPPSPDSAPGPTKGLLVCFPLDDAPKDGVKDVSGGGASASCTICPTLKAGAYEFTGKEFITVTPEARFETKQAFTVAIWAKPSVMGRFQTLASKLYGSAVANSWHLSVRSAQSCSDRFFLETHDGVLYPKIGSSELVPKDRWWHIAATWNGTTRRLYIDGALVKSDSNTTLWDGGPITIGCDWDDGAPEHFFVGALRDFRLYDRALTPAEIGQLQQVAGITQSAPTAVPGAVTQLVLVDAATDADIGPISGAATISLPVGGINLRAEVGGVPGSVRFGLDGVPSYRVESSQPFAFEGDVNGDYAAWKPATGQYAISATPFCDVGATGAKGATVTVQLTVK